MEDFSHILDNQMLFVALSACLMAQAFKLIVELVQNRKLNFRVLVETGGMPSAHSALVTALATSVGRIRGWDSIEFAIAAIFAVIVMYDAAGIRLAAGKQAKVINQIVEEVFEDDNEIDPLKELLGHTPIQVLVGAILGIGLMWWLL